jgi:DMSO/TMAO reductase YedYZ molybdopterin-dependent catalytic subunit
VLGAVLLVGLPVVIVTGLLSYVAYDPRLGGTNDQTPMHGLLGWFLFDWPTSPTSLYRVTQGLHVLVGLALVPLVLTKLWSVAPKLFALPPVKSIAQAFERLTLLLLVGGILFLFITGIMNIQYDYAFGFSFYTGHFYAAWVFIAAFGAHVAIKLPTLVRSLRSRSFRQELRTPVEQTRPEPLDDDGLVPVDPDAATMSRRGVLALAGGSSLAVVALTAGQSIDPLRGTALLSPRGQTPSGGLQINTTAANAGFDPARAGSGWRLELVGLGGRTATLSRGDLLALPQATHQLPIACVEGWSTSRRWTGVPLRDLAALVGSGAAGEVFVESLQDGGFGTMTLTGRQLREERTLLALQLEGADLPLDHGYPARMIIPAAPGVRNTKWVRRLTFRDRP